MASQENKPKKKVWLWWLGGCGLLACIAVLSIIALFLFYPSEESSFPLDGSVSFPSTVKKGEDFDFVITLSNSTTETFFIKHIVLHYYFNSPSLLDGARIISVEPDMASEPFMSENDMQFSYFQEITPGETLTVVIHMQAENTGTYYNNVGVYAKDPSKPDPAYIQAFHTSTFEIEITP